MPNTVSNDVSFTYDATTSTPPNGGLIVSAGNSIIYGDGASINQNVVRIGQDVVINAGPTQEITIQNGTITISDIGSSTLGPIPTGSINGSIIGNNVGSVISTSTTIDVVSNNTAVNNGVGTPLPITQGVLTIGPATPIFDIPTGYNEIFGTMGNDVLRGKNGVSNFIAGFEGRDVIYGGNKADAIHIGLPGNNDSIGRAQVYAGAGDDSISIYSSKNIVYGDAGNDTILVYGNSNIVYGGAGDDTLKSTGTKNYLDGGTGNDTFIFKTGFDVSGNNHVSSAGTITDFDVRSDKLVLDSAVDGRGAISSVQFSHGDTILTLNDPTSAEKATITLVGVDKTEWSHINLA